MNEKANELILPDFLRNINISKIIFPSITVIENVPKVDEQFLCPSCYNAIKQIHAHIYAASISGLKSGRSAPYIVLNSDTPKKPKIFLQNPNK